MDYLRVAKAQPERARIEVLNRTVMGSRCIAGKPHNWLDVLRPQATSHFLGRSAISTVICLFS